MLIKKDLKDKRRSIYECDRCKRRTMTENNIQIYTRENTSIIKQWDLCERCFSSLKRGIEKGVQKNDTR